MTLPQHFFTIHGFSISIFYLAWRCCIGSIWDEMHVQYRVSYWSYRAVCWDITFTVILLRQVYLCKCAVNERKAKGHCILAKGKRGMRELALICL